MRKIKNYSNRIQAEIDKGLLSANNIKSIISADDAGGARPDLLMATGGVWLYVNEKDFKKASELISDK